MTVNKDITVRVKVSLSKETKAALEAVAKMRGVSLSQLLADAAVLLYLTRSPAAQKHSNQTPKSDVSETLSQVTGVTSQNAAVPPKDRLEGVKVGHRVYPAPQLKSDGTRKWKSRHDRKFGIATIAHAKPVIATEKPDAALSAEAALATRRPVHIDNLIVRMGGDNSLKGRLCQLGGRDGGLFQGNLKQARRVEEVTTRLDPDGRSWMPISADRVYWVSLSAIEYVKQILEFQP